MKKGVEEVQQVSHKMAEAMYKQTQEQAQQAGAAGAGASTEEQQQTSSTTATEEKENIVDADFEVVDEEDKKQD